MPVTVPDTYALDSIEWPRPDPHDLPLADIHVSMSISRERGLLEACVAERPRDPSEPTVPRLRLSMSRDAWDERHPELFALLNELLWGPTRPPSGPSAVDSVRALLDKLGFADTTPDTSTGETSAP